MKSAFFYGCMLAGLTCSCRGPGDSETVSGNESASATPNSGMLETPEVSSILNEGMTSGKILEKLGEPASKELFNGTGPSFELPENMDPFIWTYKDYPGMKSGKNELVIIVASSNGPDDHGGVLLKWFISATK